MYGGELTTILRGDEYTKKHFAGVFSCDRLPILKKRQFSLVVNTQTHDKSGEHWQAIVYNRGVCHFFCSLGQRPNNYINAYLQGFKKVVHNKAAPQNNNEYTCGGYCVFVIAMMSRRNDFASVCRFFDLVKSDDKFIRYFLQEGYKYRIETPSNQLHSLR